MGKVVEPAAEPMAATAADVEAKAAAAASLARALAGESFKLRLMSNHGGQPAGWYLDAHRCGAGDTRNGGSTRALVHAADPNQESFKGDWLLEF